MKISPDGKYAAANGSITKKGKNPPRGLVIFDLDTMKVHRAFSWKPGHDIGRFYWTNNENIVFSVSKWGTYAAGLYGVSVNRNSINTVVGNDAVSRIIDPLHEEPDHSWVWFRSIYNSKPFLAKLKTTGDVSAKPGQPVPFSLNNPLVSNTIPEPAGDVYGWGIDWDGVPRLVRCYQDGNLKYLHRRNDEEDWQELPLNGEDWDIVSFTSDNKNVYVVGYGGASTKGLYLYDVASDSMGEVLFRDDYYDFSAKAKYRFYKNELIGIQYEKDVPIVSWFLPLMERIQEMVDGAIPGRANIISGWSDDFKRHLVTSFSDTSPIQYFLLDLEAREVKLISSAMPWLDADSLAKTEVFHFKTSDGLKLEGYLTRPKQGSAPYPTICLVHGGPWVRDTGSFDPETQFLASRGYAVIRVNYRGSSGYGKEISEDPAYEFRRMHDDVTEAVKMAVRHGIADEKRLAIMGASFGGYAALCGAAFEPDLYRCAITNMGVFDWALMTKARKQQEHDYSYDKLVDEIGDPKLAEKHFEEISPIHHVDKIQIPIFISHGKSDSNVSVKQSKILERELKKRKLPHKTFYREWEGHTRFSMSNRIDLYKEVEAFLAEHMK